MRIVVNHLTRMVPGRICVAGIDLDAGRHIRPRCNRTMLPLRWSVTHGGPFALGAVIDLGPTRSIGKAPEIEDHHFHEHRLRQIDQLDHDQFWDLLESQCERRLQRIFGRERQISGRTCVTNEGEGMGSLGCLIPSRIHALIVNAHRTVRLLVDVGQASLDLPVTDLRFYNMNDVTAEWTVEHDRVDHVRDALRAGTPTILSVGLTRPFRRTQDEPPRHWLQVNNIHLSSDPLGDRC